MKYEFGDERASRKKRNIIAAAIIVLVLAVVAGLGYSYGVENGLLPFGDKKAAEPKIEEKVVTQVTEPETVKPEEVKSETAKPVTEEVKQAEAYTIIIDKSDFSLTLKKGDTVEKVYDVAIGKNQGQKQKIGDLTTPTGEFEVDEILDASYWKHDFNDGKGEIEGAYGPWFISLKTGWDGIGIHGTHDPASIKTMVSEGCIRMNNSDVEELKNRVQVGAKVIIQE